MKHKLIVIGVTGRQRCYLDVDREEAIRRYRERDDAIEEAKVFEIEFDDEFGTYAVWAEWMK